MSILTSRDLMQATVIANLVDDAEAAVIYANMIAKGHRGPQDLWS